MMMNRVWAMPSPLTYTVKPIKEVVERYLETVGGVSLDPFARDTEYATYRNDIHPDTKAQYHEDAYAFLLRMERQIGRANLVLFDPPYSPRQAVDCYQAAGVDPKELDAALNRKANAWQRTKNWREEKDTIARMQQPGDIVISFGWDSNGMGKGRGYEIIELLLVCHGACHNDTICTVERRAAQRVVEAPPRLFAEVASNVGLARSGCLRRLTFKGEEDETVFDFARAEQRLQHLRLGSSGRAGRRNREADGPGRWDANR